ncbi:hypothetical protein C2857_007792 [Epichloe festucae Fl1]|uniref:Uncharacterized protein n=1 Tax=Epichloe festucae (strain Fl1) TaxID=877507 RepID=A0A7S9KMS5_EPIFF|nr:hypothetical protein C2857_007792 [Epichloe festucae Fl1]
MSDPGHPMGLWLWLELPVSHMLSNIYGLASKQPHHLPHHELQKLFAADEAGIQVDSYDGKVSTKDLKRGYQSLVGTPAVP